MKGSARGSDSQPCPDPTLGLSPIPLPYSQPLGSHQERLAPNHGAGHSMALLGGAAWAHVAPQRTSAAWLGGETPAHSKRMPGNGLRYGFPEERGSPREAPVLISLSSPAKQERLSSNSGDTPISQRRIGPRCFVALGKY